MAFLHWVYSSDIFVLFVVLLISVIMFLYKRSKCPSSTPLMINWPFFGMTPHLLLNGHRLHDFATDIVRSTAGTFLFKGPWFANMDLLLTSDPANIHHILSKNFPNYPKGPDFRSIFDILGDGIFNSDHHLWELHRKTTASIFKHPDFYTLLEVTIRNKLDKGLLPLLHHFVSQEIEMDLQEIFQRLTFDSICLLLLDYDPESLSPHLPFIPCEKAFTDVEEALLWRHVWPQYLWKLQQRLGIGKEKKMKEAWKDFDEFIYKCLPAPDDDQKLEDDEEGRGRGRGWLLRSLMRGFQGESRKFLKDAILNLMIAGRDTTSTALSWFMYLVAKNPSVEDKIREEIEKQLGGRNKWKTMGAKELEGLVYLHGGLCEALRLYPPVAFEHKSPMERDVLPSGHQVDEQTKIILSFYSMGRMGWIWGDDCMEFKPERWFCSNNDNKVVGIKHEASYKFTAFHAGPRRCLGKEMGMIQMKMVAAALVYHYHVELVEGHQVCPSDSIILQMKYGLRVRLFPIN